MIIVVDILINIPPLKSIFVAVKSLFFLCVICSIYPVIIEKMDIANIKTLFQRNKISTNYKILLVFRLNEPQVFVNCFIQVHFMAKLVYKYRLLLNGWVLACVGLS
jgi:hypothetical protein